MMSYHVNDCKWLGTRHYARLSFAAPTDTCDYSFIFNIHDVEIRWRTQICYKRDDWTACLSNVPHVRVLQRRNTEYPFAWNIHAHTLSIKFCWMSTRVPSVYVIIDRRPRKPGTYIPRMKFPKLCVPKIDVLIYVKHRDPQKCAIFIRRYIRISFSRV